MNKSKGKHNNITNAMSTNTVQIQIHIIIIILAILKLQ